MLKRSLLFAVVLASAQLVCADELPDDCEAAVDAADRLGATNDKHCDYSKTGLNGVLHKTFANREAAPGSATKTEANTSVKANLPRALARDFSSAQQLSAVRYELLQLAGKECAAGFVLLDERYLPFAEKHLQLELNYRCL